MEGYEQKTQRVYARGDHFSTEVKVSRDGFQWKKAMAGELSSGGLSLFTKNEYQVGDELWFDLKVSGFMSEFEVKTQGCIRRKNRTEEGAFEYGVSFIGLSQELKIRIDENVHNDRPISGGSYSL
jgi:Tfp pilus assembly protein PilZ